MPICKVLALDPISGDNLPDSYCQCTREPTVVGTPTQMALPNIFGENPHRAGRDFVVAESFTQPTVALERPTACRSDSMPKGPLEYVRALPLTVETLEHVLACPQTEKPLRIVALALSLSHGGVTEKRAHVPPEGRAAGECARLPSGGVAAGERAC